jgi:hypothetical protein
MLFYDFRWARDPTLAYRPALFHSVNGENKTGPTRSLIWAVRSVAIPDAFRDDVTLLAGISR